jgi:CHAT domain-containing protein
LRNPRTALLEFVVTEYRVLVFVLKQKQAPDSRVGGSSAQKNSGSSAVDLSAHIIRARRKELEETVRGLRARLASRRPGFQEFATRLYDQLIKPAAAELKDVDNLVIVPDGILWALPFQALQSSANRYLIEDYAISYAPSLGVLREIAKEKRRATGRVPTTLLAIGNPTIATATADRVKSAFMDEMLVPLPDAERQVKALGRLYGPNASKIYVGADASEERLKQEAGRCRILHIATHGIINWASPLYSQLVLSTSGDNSGEDGLLEAWELMNLDLNADLVVLSACETGQGRIGAGEGMIGFSWALFVAGCPTVVVSQWKVESGSTADLMIEFHKALTASRKQTVSKAAALRLASLKLLRTGRYRHPFYWASFVVVGNGY